MASSPAAVHEEDEHGLFLDRYVIEKQLGEGSYGKVKLAVDNETNRRVALKIIHKSTIKKPEHITRIKREVRIMRLLNHSSIVKLYDVAETDKDIVLALEYVEGGELFDFIVAQNRLNDKTARKIFRQMVSAVDYCHQSSVIHRDLKPENLLMDLKRNIKIIDFGFVNLFDPEDTLKTFCGSPFYASPEMILGRQYVGPEVDIWSMGVILYALLTGQLPFRDVNTKDLYRKITTSTFDIPGYVPEDASHLIRKMLCVDPQNRATLEYIKNHSWTNKGFDHSPDSQVPGRHKLEEPLDEKVVETMRLYGYDATAARAAILASPERGPAFSLYWLLKEQEESTNLARQKSQYLQNHASLARQNSTAISGSTLTVPRHESSIDLGGGNLSHADSTSTSIRGKGAMKRRKSISGAIRQNPMPARSTNQLPSTDENEFPPTHSGSSAATTQDGRAQSTLAVSEHRRRRGSVNESPTLSRGQSTEEDIKSQSAVVQRRRSISAVQTQYNPLQNKMRRRMTEHARPARVTMGTQDSLSPGKHHTSGHSNGAVPDLSRESSSQAVDEDTVPPMVNHSETSTTNSNRNSSQKPPPTQQMSVSPSSNNIVSESLDRPKRKISLNLGQAISNAFSKMRPSSASSHKRQDSNGSNASTVGGSTVPKPRVSKSMYAADTTSSKPPEEIIKELNRVFLQIGVMSAWSGFKVYCSAQNVEFQIEICQIKGTHMHGLELRRKKGSTWTYQVVCRSIISQLKL
ncbi:Serine/threonine-protein kinase par-1 [Phlyctochytrium planicorne]|nr:Serine/threonine-protein kinase par-1 [Phlyctochytrium planicorne]